VLAWYVLSGRNLARFVLTRLRSAMFKEITRVGLVAAFVSLQTNLTIALTTALVARSAGPDAVAGFGTGARLEYLLIPLVFGFGAPMVAMVGTNIGAGQGARALRIALIGGAIAFAITETIGLLAATFPYAWLSLFGSNPEMLATGSAYLRAVGPAYGFFGLGLALYFASQGVGKLLWPVCSGLLRLVIAVGGGWAAFAITGSLAWMFAALAVGLVAYGLSLTAAIASGAWFRAPVRRA
jgi:Na+-driven multidrug efflux pump